MIMQLQIDRFMQQCLEYLIRRPKNSLLLTYICWYTLDKRDLHLPDVTKHFLYPQSSRYLEMGKTRKKLPCSDTIFFEKKHNLGYLNMVGWKWCNKDSKDQNTDLHCRIKNTPKNWPKIAENGNLGKIILSQNWLKLFCYSNFLLLHKSARYILAKQQRPSCPNR